MSDKSYVPLSNYIPESMMPLNLINEYSDELLEYLGFDDGLLFWDDNVKKANIVLTNEKEATLDLAAGFSVGLGKGKLQVTFYQDNAKTQFRAYIEKFNLELPVFSVADVEVLLNLNHSQDIHEYQFALKNVLIGKLLVNNADLHIQHEDGNNKVSTALKFTWDIIANRFSGIAGDVPKPNSDTVVDCNLDWDESDAAETVHFKLKTQIAELANEFFSMIPAGFRPEVVSWTFNLETTYTGYSSFENEDQSTDFSGDVFSEIELIIPERLQGKDSDIFELHFGNDENTIRAKIDVKGIGKSDTNIEFELLDPVALFIKVSDDPAAEKMKFHFTSFSYNKAEGDLKFAGNFKYKKVSGSASFDFDFPDDSSSSWRGNLNFGYYTNNFQIEISSEFDFGTASATVDPNDDDNTTVDNDSSSSSIKGEVKISKITLGDDQIFAKLNAASFGFDYKYENNETAFNILANFDLLFQLSAQNLDGFLKNIIPSTPLQLPIKKQLEWKVIEPKPQGSPAAKNFSLPAAGKADGAASGSGDIIKNMNAAIAKQSSAGAMKFDYELPIHKDLFGVINIDSIGEKHTMTPGGVNSKVILNFGATLGPIKVLVKGMGVEADVKWESPTKNLGIVDLQAKFLPPTGVGLVIDAGVVKGGGFLLLDYDKGEYAGALELSIKDKLQIAAVGIINTKMPDGSAGFSLLVVVSVQFTPGIALGMGFFLNGLGGMLGLHRTINVPALQKGVRDNALEHILFPKDVVANMNTLLPQLKAIFPIQKNQFMIGLMAKITWGVPTLVSIEFGLAIEFANPVRLAILGVLKVALPTEEAALLRLQVNFVGVIDFEKSTLAFDASLYNSRILTFTLEGDMALRLSWGAQKAFLLSAGGFHPTFRPPQELKVPSLKRLTLTILSGNPNLVLTAYFAVTSNTVQFGARIDFRLEVESFKVLGFMSFDVLFQFSPFRFIAQLQARLEVKMGSTSLLSITLDFTLSGPTPWNARGIASFSILFFTVKVRFNITWGEAEQLIEPSIAVLPKVTEAFTLDANWTTELPSNRYQLVALASTTPQPGKIILQSFGALKVSQTVLPLNLQIQKFGNHKPQDISLADVESFKLGGLPMTTKEVRESFAPATFKTLADTDRLKSPSYTQEKGGVKVADTSGLTVNYARKKEVNYEVKVSDMGTPGQTGTMTLDMAMFGMMTRGGAVGKSALSAENRNKKQIASSAVEISEEKYVLVNTSTLAQHGAAEFAGGSLAEATDRMKGELEKSPNLKGKIAVMPAYQLL